MNDGLRRLSEQVRRDLSLLDYPRRPWLTPRESAQGSPILDVIIVGAGQSGLACAFALARERVSRVLVVDQNPLDQAGPWLNFARMRTLRTPKYLTGPDLGIASLTPRAFYEAKYGEAAWEALDLLPKEDWAAYLSWYRETLELPVVAQTHVGPLRYDARERAWQVPCRRGDHIETRLARRVVLATGIEGSGGWSVPAFIKESLPKALYAHTAEAIDFEKLSGKRVAVLGAGASAFDNAACALEHGAFSVQLFFRRPELVRVNPYRWAEFAGFLHHFADLPDADKWRFMARLMEMGQLPPADTFRRASQHAAFALHPGEPLEAARPVAEALELVTPKRSYPVDYLIVGTGFVTELSLRAELSHIAPQIARWSDRYTPPDPAAHPDLARHPYLGPHFEFTERTPGSAPELATLYNYTFGGLLSLGFGGASISGMKYSLPRLVSGITRSLFLEDRDAHFASLSAFGEQEF